MKSRLFFAILFFALSASFGADKWQVYSNPLPIYNAIPFGSDGVMLATDGGVRYRTLKDDFVFHADNGLESSCIYAMLRSEMGYFSVSQEGIISIFDEGRWRVISRSFVSNKSNVVPGAAVIAGPIMVIGFGDRLAFYDAPAARSILTINRIRNNFLAVNHVRKVSVDGDSLYVQLDKGVFVRKMEWKNLNSDVTLVDPESWTEVPEDVMVKGLEPWDSTQVVVDGKVLRDSALYEHIERRREQMPYDILIYDKSRIHQVVPVETGHFLVGPEALFFYDGSKVVDLLYNGDFPSTNIYEVKAFPGPGGGVFAASSDGEFTLMEGNQGWRLPVVVPDGSYETSFASRLKVLSYLPSGHLLFHVWGMNYFGYSDWGGRLIFVHSGGSPQSSCLEGYAKNNYVISVATTPAPDNSGFIVAMGSNEGYSLAYMSKDGEILCADHVGNTFMGAPFYSTIDENGHWVVYLSARSGGSLSDDGGLDILTIPSPKSVGGEFIVTGKKLVRGLIQTPIDMVYEPIQKRLWMVSLSSMAYYDETRDTLLQPASISGLQGVEFTSIDKDPHGNLWVGTAENGAFRVSMKGKSPDTLVAVNYSARNGMLSNRVNDLAVDAMGGKIWFAHDKGVSSLERGELRDASSFMTDSATALLRVYPVPFRPKVHSAFIIENIAESSVVSIYNRGGSLIRAFSGKEIIGGRLEWDGHGKDGALVVPGVYYYVIRTSSKTKKGKFIISH